MQGLDNIIDVLLSDVTANAEVHFQKLVSLVQLALDDVSVDSLDDEVFQFPEIPHLQVLQQHGVGDTLQIRPCDIYKNHWQTLKKCKYYQHSQQLPLGFGKCSVMIIINIYGNKRWINEL